MFEYLKWIESILVSPVAEILIFYNNTLFKKKISCKCYLNFPKDVSSFICQSALYFFLLSNWK